MKLRNEFKIVSKNGTTKLAKNKVLPKLFEKLEQYQGYAKYVAFGCGEVSKEHPDGSLENGVMHSVIGLAKVKGATFQLNPQKGAMEASYKIVVPDVLAGKSATEIGFCLLPDGVLDTDFDEDGGYLQEGLVASMCNHAHFEDDLGQIAEVELEAGMEIFATIFLAWDTTEGIMPLGGNNKFAKFLLGSDEFLGEAPVFHFGIGQNHAPNDRQVECNFVPSMRYMQEVTPSVRRRNGMIEFLFAASNPDGAYVCELALVANGKTVVRQSREHISSTDTYNETVTATALGTVCLKRPMVTKINRLTNNTTGEVFETEEQIASIPKQRIGAMFSEAVPMPFGEGKDYDLEHGWRAFDSKCGNMLCMVSSERVDIYKDQNGVLVPMDASLVDEPQQLVDVEFFEDFLFAKRNIAPYIDVYKFENGRWVPMVFSLEQAFADANIGAPYVGGADQEVSFGTNTSGHVTAVFKLSSSEAPVVLEFVQNGRVLEFVSSHALPLVTVTHVGATLASGNVEGVCFGCGTDVSTTNVVWTYSAAEGDQLVTNAQATTELCTNVQKFVVGNRFVYVKRSVNPVNTCYFFSNKKRLFFYNDTTTLTFINKGGYVFGKWVENGNKLQGMYITYDLNMQTLTNIPDESIYSGRIIDMKHIGNSCILFTRGTPCTYRFTFDGEGYNVLSGFVPGHSVTVQETASLAYSEKGKRNLLLSLALLSE